MTGTIESKRSIVSLVREMVLSLIDEPASMIVDGNLEGDCMLVNVTVAQGDVGKVIGKQGRTARSMRTILDAASRKSKVRCELNINEYINQEGRER